MANAFFIINTENFKITNTSFFTISFFGREVKFYFTDYDYDVISGFPGILKIIRKS